MNVVNKYIRWKELQEEVGINNIMYNNVNNIFTFDTKIINKIFLLYSMT
jgi:alpha-glucuronidase